MNSDRPTYVRQRALPDGCAADRTLPSVTAPSQTGVCSLLPVVGEGLRAITTYLMGLADPGARTCACAQFAAHG